MQTRDQKCLSFKRLLVRIIARRIGVKILNKLSEWSREKKVIAKKKGNESSMQINENDSEKGIGRKRMIRIMRTKDARETVKDLEIVNEKEILNDEAVIEIGANATEKSTEKENTNGVKAKDSEIDYVRWTECEIVTDGITEERDKLTEDLHMKANMIKSLVSVKLKQIKNEVQIEITVK